MQKFPWGQINIPIYKYQVTKPVLPIDKRNNAPLILFASFETLHAWPGLLLD